MSNSMQQVTTSRQTKRRESDTEREDADTTRHERLMQLRLQSNLCKACARFFTKPLREFLTRCRSHSTPCDDDSVCCLIRAAHLFAFLSASPSLVLNILHGFIIPAWQSNAMYRDEVPFIFLLCSVMWVCMQHLSY